MATRDRRDRQADARDGGAVGEVEAGLDPVAARVADRGERLRQQHEQGDEHADRRLRRPDRVDRVLDRVRLELGERDHGHERHDEQSHADQRRAVGGRVGVLLRTGLGQEVVAVPDGLDEHEQPVERERGDGGEGQLGGRELGPGRLVVKVGTTSVSVASVATVASAVALPSALKVASRGSQRAHEQRDADDAVAGDHHGREHGVARERRGLVAAGDHERDDQRHLDHGDRDREHERPERLADPVRHHLGVVDGGQHGPGQQQPGDDQHDRAGMAAERDDRDQRRGGRHRGGPPHHRSPRSTSSASPARSAGTSRWSWWTPASTLQLIPASASARLNSAVGPTCSSVESTRNVIHGAT